MNTRQKFNIGIWVMVAVTSLLVVATSLVIILRLANYLPNEMDMFVLEAHNPEVSLGDEDGWDNNQSIEIFSAEYTDKAGNVVVKNLVDDGAIMAPGVETSYQFYIKNTGNVALDYSVELDPKFMIGAEIADLENSPFEVRLYNQYGTYLIGSETEWVNVNKTKAVMDTGVVGKNSYYGYVFEWRWPYESGNDGRDTNLGMISMGQPVVLTLDLGMSATESTDIYATGGSPMDANGTSLLLDVGDFEWVPMVVLVSLTLASAGGLIFLVLSKRIVINSKKRKGN